MRASKKENHQKIYFNKYFRLDVLISDGVRTLNDLIYAHPTGDPLLRKAVATVPSLRGGFVHV